MINNFIIVDEHTHIYPNPQKAKQILESFTSLHKMDPTHLGAGTMDEILFNMRQGGIDFTLLANFAPAKILHNNNLWTIGISREHKCLVPLISLHPDMEGNPLDLLKEYIALGAKGIKFHTAAQDFIPDHPKLRDVYEYCNKIAFPVLFHCGLTSKEVKDRYADLDMLFPIIDRYKKIPIILAHMAEGKINDILYLSRHYNHVYFDTSIAITGFLRIKRVHDDCWQDDDFVIDSIQKIGAKKIIFGSDYPFGSPIDDINRFLRLNISENEKKLILGENTIKVFNMKNSLFAGSCALTLSSLMIAGYIRI